MVVVPAHLVGQMYDELLKFTEGFEIFEYYGDHRSEFGSNGRRQIKGHLSKDHDLFTNRRTDPALRIVVTSHHTLTARHGKKKLHEWRMKATNNDQVLCDSLADEPDHNCPDLLMGLFGFVAVDEAHIVSHFSVAAT